MRHRKIYEFKCGICRNFAKELHNCDLTFEGKTVTIMVCHRCMRKVGLKEDKREAGDPLNS